MLKNKKKGVTTTVSPSIMRQCPQFTKLLKLKKLHASVSIDYLSINVDSINENFLRTYCTRKYDTRNKGFNLVEVFSFNGFEYTVSSQKQFNGNQDEDKLQYQITINPSYYPSGDHVKKLLELITPDLKDESSQEISRLDISFALSSEILTPLMVYNMCHFRWKRSSTDFRQHKNSGKLTGIQCPSRSMSNSIYLHDLAPRSNYKPKLHVTEENMTIFELQLKKPILKSIRLHTVFDLENLQWKKVFNKFEFYDVIHFKKLSPEVLPRIEIFQDDVKTMGFHHARAEYNNTHNRNFIRDIGSSLHEMRINNGKARLSACFRMRFEEYLSIWNPWSSAKLLNNDKSNFVPQSFGEIPLNNPPLN